MGIFDKAENEAEDLARKDPNLADKGLDELGNEANQATGDRFGNQVNEGVRDAQNWVGQQGGAQAPNQGGYQDPNQSGQGGYQDPNQSGQGGYQDPSQGGVQDPSQGGYQDQEQNQGW
jgi:hypothetical protein